MLDPNRVTSVVGHDDFALKASCPLNDLASALFLIGSTQSGDGGNDAVWVGVPRPRV